MKKNKKLLFTFLKGAAMGSVDIVPGMSGGTMALILKIYTKIINEIRLINKDFFKNIIKLKIRKAFELIDWPFLLSLFLGIITAIISLARIISWILANSPEYLYSFFFGLILVSAIFLMPKKIKNKKNFLFLFLGFAIAAIISFASSSSTPENYLFIFVSGALAICAMILPGISGAFILLLLGKYEFMISAIKNPLILSNLIIIIIFILGCLVGILSFAKILGFLIKKYYHATLMLLIGFMLGALFKIWPFKQSTENIVNEQIVIREINVLPEINTFIIFPVLFFVFGVATGLLLSKIKREKSLQ
jgi:putative membrane protein